jgi:hypothetical protein
LDNNVDRVFDSKHDVQVGRLAAERAVQVHHMEPLGALSHPLFGDFHRVGRIRRLLSGIAVGQPNHGTGFDVNGRNYEHGITSLFGNARQQARQETKARRAAFFRMKLRGR